MTHPSPTPAPNEPTRRRRVGLVASLAFHAVLLTLLVVVPYQIWYAPGEEAKPTASTSSGSDSNPATGKGKVNKPEDITAEKVESKIASVVKEADKLTDEEKLDRLAGAAGQLENLATEESVNEVNDKLRKLLGTPERAAQPSVEPVAGPFDYDTAQYHDVKRVKDRDGVWQYTAVLIDAKGRTLEAPMTTPAERAEAEKVYQTMQILKSNPLAEKVYRDIGMGQIDRLIGAFGKLQEAGEKLNAEQQKREQESAKDDAKSNQSKAKSPQEKSEPPRNVPD